MQIRIDDEVYADMKRRNKNVISVEVATSDHSDFEVTEIYLRYVRDAFADYLVNEKRYTRVRAGERGDVLLPPYRLEYAPEVTICFKKVWLFKKLHAEGIDL